jgi:hypothetical protein
MEKVQASEVTLRIPPSIAAGIGSNEIIKLLLDKALGKKDLYKSKIKMLESKYGTNYTSFKKRIEKGDENFQEWDDLLLWEGFLLAHKEWNRKYKDLKLCMK